MKILMTGATGLVGKALGKRLVKEGHSLVVVSRNAERAQTDLPFPCEAFAWNADKDLLSSDALRGVEAVIHLAGEPVASSRWTKEKKEKIYHSRVDGTRHLMQSLAQLGESKPKTVISASATGIYGDRGAESLSETSAVGKGFLAEVCRDWEKALFEPALLDVRTVAIRVGIVLNRRGGALEKIYPIFQSGFGARSVMANNG